MPSGKDITPEARPVPPFPSSHYVCPRCLRSVPERAGICTCDGRIDIEEDSNG